MLKRVDFRSDTRKVIQSFPRDVRDSLGKALLVAQMGGRDKRAKPLQGFGGAQVMEICDNCPDGAFRAIYTTMIQDVVVVIHAFQKKSTKGISTPKREIDLIRQRLKEVKEDYRC